MTPPTMRPYGRQLLLCNHGDCVDASLAERLHARLGELNRQQGLNKLRNPHRLKCALVDCLGVCQGGPILVVYPDGIWYHHVDEAALERIYQEHLLQGQPIEELIFHRLYPPGSEPAYPPTVRGDAPLATELSTATPTLSTDVAAQTAHATDAGVIDAEARRIAARRANQKKGLILVNTGEGKGKTTAALGVLMRAWGRNLRTGLIQFLKHENARFGEIRAAERMGIERIGLGDGWTWTSRDLDETQARAVAGWALAQQHILSGAYDVLVLDEFTYPLHYGWLDSNAVLAWLEAHKPPLLHLIITGRYAPQNLIDFADLVTEMRAIKHPLSEQGIRAQAGIEF
jgi:cob(I)alamin adenosyltransferase